MIRCPCCQREVTDWRPWKVSGRLIITWTCSGRAYTAEADFVVTAIREGMRQ